MTTAESFFKSGETISVEARSANGQPVPPENRHVTRVLQRVAQFAKQATVALLIASISAGALAGLKTPSAPVITPTAIIQQAKSITPDWTAIGKMALANTSPSVMKYVNKTEFRQGSTDELYALMAPQGDTQDTITCTFVLGGLDGSITSLLGQKLPQNELDMMRELMIHHEVAHCETQAGILKDSIEGELGANGASNHYFKDGWSTSGSMSEFNISQNLNTLTGERQADAKALLVMANKTMGQANFQSEINAGLKEFDKYADLLIKFRINESTRMQKEGLGHFHNHDTVPVNQAIKAIVHDAAHSPADFSAFKKTALDSVKSSDFAMMIAIGATRSEAPNLHKPMVEESITMALNSFLSQANIEKDASIKTFDGALKISPLLNSAKSLQEKLDVAIRLDTSGKLLKDITFLNDISSHSADRYWPKDTNQDPAVMSVLQQADALYQSAKKIMESNGTTPKFYYSSIEQIVPAGTTLELPIKTFVLESSTTSVIGDAAEDYKFESLFSETFEESLIAQKKFVEDLSADILNRHSIVVSDNTLVECLAGNRCDGIAHGKILTIDFNSGLVIQSLGRGKTTVHNLKDFADIPVVGHNSAILYKDGKMQGNLEQGAQKPGASVGR